MEGFNEMERGDICTAAVRCMHDLEGSLSSFPGLLKAIIRERAWERRFAFGQMIELPTLADLITRKPIEGWGEDLDAVKRLIREDAEALSLLDAELQRKPGRPIKDHETLNNVMDYPEGNTREAALRRLRTQRPDLHDAVIAGEVSAHAAMVAAGFRRKTFTVPAGDAQRAMKAILKHYTRDEMRAAIEAE